MYGKRGSELVKELASSEPGQLSAFNNDLFAQVINECTGHLHHLGLLIRKIEELKKIEEKKKLNNQELEESEKPLLKAHNSGALIHHLSLLRNKRCLMAYVYNRAETIRSLGWAVERVLPEEIEEKLSGSEKEYFKNHAASLQSYMSELDLDLGVTVQPAAILQSRKLISLLFLYLKSGYSSDMVPPKDPYIKVRVLEDIGNVLLSDQSANLARHAILFLRRTDAEQYISQGLMEELTG
ncbi:uncharacterized protein [Coffea arabica]|uniref:Uncharacterized protein isoform X1 n=1 Tax=Coffea arabica TaxID=13443 RepID=A0A6P6X8M6_COFAR|nr:DNA replication complex GINS protein PSF1-like isoform X1 [Coffea arabica]XP_027123286.1 DNA replication complex GINS protein PSF1-like isoform X1 [Coffea arabica]